MDNAVDLLLRQGTVALAVLVVIITFFARRIVETAAPSVKKQADANEKGATYLTSFSRWWNEVILYAIPPLAGGLMGLAKTPFIFPTEDFQTMGGRVIFGIGIGWFSSFLYKVLRKMVSKSTGVELPSANQAPGEP